MKKFLVLGIAIIIAVGLISLSGCLKFQQTKSVPNGNITVPTNGAKAIKLTSAMAKKDDAIVRPILTKVYGDATPRTEFNYQGSVSVIYVVPNKVTSNDYQSLINEIKESGYNIQMQRLDNNSYTAMFEYGNYSIIITGNLNSKDVMTSIINQS